MADLDSTEIRNRTSDIREWIFEAVDKIGAPMQYISKESGADGVPVFKIQDNQIPIPADLQHLDGVAYATNPGGPWIPMVKTTKIFKEPKKKHNDPYTVTTTMPHDQENVAIDDVLEVTPKHQPMAHKMITSQSQLYDTNMYSYIERMIPGRHHSNKPEYFIKPGWIVTNKDKGYIKLAYKAIATDERGYPLIPDLTSYQEAVYWYVVMKLTFPKYMQGALSGRSNRYSAKYAAQSYTYIQQQWNFYRNQAYAEAMMPTPADMENIKNDWNKLIPDFEGEDRFFDNISDNQQFYNDYYYGH